MRHLFEEVLEKKTYEFYTVFKSLELAAYEVIICVSKLFITVFLGSSRADRLWFIFV